MKRRTKIFLPLVLGLAMATLSCKKEKDLYWIASGEANVIYNSTRDETSVRVFFSLVSWNKVDAVVRDWRFVFKAGKAKLLEVNSGNFQQYVPFAAFGPVRHNNTSIFIVQSVNFADESDKRPYEGKLFAGDPPDNMDVFLTIVDGAGRVESTEQNLLVYYSTPQL